MSIGSMRTSNRKSKPVRYWLLLAILLFGLLSCGERPAPETIARGFVDACEEAVQQRRPSALRDLIATDYRDAEGRTGQEVLGIAAGYLLRNRSVHLITRIQSAERRDERIAATVLAALAGRPVDDVALLPSVDADIYWFDVELVEEDGDWRVISAAWRPALVDDFLAP